MLRLQASTTLPGESPLNSLTDSYVAYLILGYWSCGKASFLTVHVLEEDPDSKQMYVTWHRGKLGFFVFFFFKLDRGNRKFRDLGKGYFIVPAQES